MVDPDTDDTADPGAVASAVASAVERFFVKVVARESMRRVLVALSGGPDSVALLCATVQCARRHGVDVVACWVNHALRPEAELLEEEAFVRSLCRRLGVELVVQVATRGQIDAAAGRSGGIEAAARDFRYDALERTRVLQRCDVILTGHTADDVMETMVMRFFTGSGSAGLRGIPERNGHIARPMLSVRKADGLAYLAEQGQPYRVDSTNEADDYLRNRVRHDLLPVVMSIFPACASALGTLAGKMRLDDDALSAQAFALGSPIDAGRFDEAPVAVRVRALYRAACDQGFERLPWRVVLAAANAPAIDGPLASGGGLEFHRLERHIVARTVRASRLPKSGPLEEGFAVRVSDFGVYRIGKAAGCRVYSSNQVPGLRLDSFEWPLWIRSRRPGDAIMTVGGLKMVDALLSEHRRDAGPPGTTIVIEDRSGIVAVLPGQSERRPVYRINDRLIDTEAPGFLVFDLKGVVRTDAV